MALSLRNIVHNRYDSFVPANFSVINNVLSLAKYDVGDQTYRNSDGHVSLRLLLTALEQPVPSVNLTGFWQADNNAFYYLRQEDNGTLWWVGFSADPDPDLNATHGLQQGLSYTSVFQGQMGGTLIEGVWVDVPRGERLNTGRLMLHFTPFAQPTQLSKIASSGDGFAESTWGLQPPPPLPGYTTIDSIFGGILKNDDSLLKDNLMPYKDAAAVFCLVMPDPDFPADPDPNSPNHKRGVPNVPQWHLNYPHGVPTTFEYFACHVDSDHEDGDLNMHIQLLPELYNDASTFWDQSQTVWDRDHTLIQEKLKHNPQGEYVLHFEVIMFGRDADCASKDRYNTAPLLPGWQELYGNSVLLNGRPINGNVSTAAGPIPGTDGHEYYGATLGDVTKIIAGQTLLRVTGALILDCGHYRADDPLDPCGDDDPDYVNLEIHPVYAIDIIDETSSDDWSGTWSDDKGRTFYLSQLGDNTLWGLGMSPFRDLSFTRVFQGTIQPDQSVTGHWVDVPFGGPFAAGSNTGSMTLRLQRPGDASLFDHTISRFVTWSDSPVEQRWTKLYDISPPV